MIKQSDVIRKKYIDGLSAEFAASRQRYHAMAAAAQSEADVQKIQTLLQALPCTSVTVEKFFADPDQKELAGWHISACKS